MDAERIMERVRRLLAIANDPAASDNEQRIALEQAQRLMDRHAIEEWQLEEDHDAIEIIRRMIHLKPTHATGTWPNSPTSSHWETDAGRHTDGGGPGTDGTSSAPSAFTEPAPTWTRPKPSDGYGDQPSCHVAGTARTTPRAKANAAWRNGYYRGFQEEIARRYAILRRRWNRTAPAGNSSPSAAARSINGSKNTSPSATVGRNSPSPRDPASRPTGTEDRTGHARPSDSSETGKAADWALEK